MTTQRHAISAEQRELMQRSADWLHDRSETGYGPVAAAGMALDYELGRMDRAERLLDWGKSG